MNFAREAIQPVTIPHGIGRHFRRRHSAQLGLVLALLIIVATAFGPWVAGFDPAQTNPTQKLQPPSRTHLLGTDQFGRDQLARVLEGGRRSLGASLLVLVGVVLVSLLVGVVTGMMGGWADALTQRGLDVLLALPALVLALAIVGVLGAGFRNLLLALLVSSWAYYARLARSSVRLAKTRLDVIADRMAGVGWARVIAGHIVPGVALQLLIVATLDLSGIIIGIAGLSFLGLGVQPPDAEWGAMLAEARLYFTLAPWLLIAPATAIFLSVVAANLIGNALREAVIGGAR